MVINLSEVIFTNGFFSVDLPEGKSLLMYNVEESLLTATSSFDINSIAIQIVSVANDTYTYEDCSCIIGLSGKNTKIDTNYNEYKGKVLNSENLRFCTLEYYE